MAVKIVDMNGTVKDWDWLEAKFGLVQIVSPGAGVTAYRVVQLQEVEGNTEMTCSVLDPDGRPVVGQQVAYMWPYPPDTELLHTTDVYGVAKHQPGPGEKYWPPGPGPSGWEVRGANTERILGLGMLDGTNHIHLQVIMRLDGEGGEEPPPGTGELTDAIYALADAVTVAGQNIEAGFRLLAGAVRSLKPPAGQTRPAGPAPEECP
jgi:hypothetical protein